MAMTMRVATLAAACSFAVSGVAAAKDVVVSFTGCTAAGVESGCLIVASGGKTYNISSARPRPGLGRAIAGRGILADEMSHCMQGRILKDVHWRYVRHAKPCPDADRPRS
jgi:hypothetical protein